MSGEIKTRDHWLKKFENSLATLAGSDQFPRPMVGDLDDLLCTLEETAELLRLLVDPERSTDRKKLREIFSKLTIKLDSDLPMILKDLVPSMVQLTDSLPDAEDGGRKKRTPGG